MKQGHESMVEKELQMLCKLPKVAQAGDNNISERSKRALLALNTCTVIVTSAATKGQGPQGCFNLCWTEFN